MRFFLSAFLLSSLALSAQTPSLDSLDSMARKALQDSGTPGAAIAIVKGDRVIYQKTFGVASIETGEALTPDTLFRIGSTTKMFTAAAVLSLVSDGRLQLDQPIAKYVTGLPAPIAALTLHQLLSHTAGLGDQPSGHGSHDDAALGQRIRSLNPDILELESGAVYSYASLGYWIAGLVLESAAGKPFADAVAEQVFQPLGMTRTTFRPFIAMTYPFAQQHEGGPGKPIKIIRPFADDTATWPGGSLFASAADLARFAVAFLNQGRLDGKQALPLATIQAMSKPQAAVPGGDSHYTYGLVLSTDRGVQTLSHGGARVGFGSILVMAPKEQVAVIIVTNRSGSTLPSLAQHAMNLFVEFGPESPPPPPVKLSEETLRSYTGAYIGGTIRVTIELEAGQLYVVFEGKRHPAQPETETSFNSAGPLGGFTFVPGPDGKPRYLHIGLRTLRRLTEPRQ